MYKFYYLCKSPASFERLRSIIYREKKVGKPIQSFACRSQNFILTSQTLDLKPADDVVTLELKEHIERLEKIS